MYELDEKLFEKIFSSTGLKKEIEKKVKVKKTRVILTKAQKVVQLLNKFNRRRYRSSK